MVVTSFFRAGFDLVSGYKHKPIPPNHNMSLEELRKGGYILDEHGWLNVSHLVHNVCIRKSKVVK